MCRFPCCCCCCFSSAHHWLTKLYLCFSTNFYIENFQEVNEKEIEKSETKIMNTGYITEYFKWETVLSKILQPIQNEIQRERGKNAQLLHKVWSKTFYSSWSYQHGLSGNSSSWLHIKQQSLLRLNFLVHSHYQSIYLAVLCLCMNVSIRLTHFDHSFGMRTSRHLSFHLMKSQYLASCWEFRLVYEFIWPKQSNRELINFQNNSIRRVAHCFNLFVCVGRYQREIN